jgi:hypothetical protein
MSEAFALDHAEAAYVRRIRDLTNQEWRELRSALARVEVAESLGRWSPSVELDDGSWQMSFAVLSSEAEDLLGSLDQLGLHIPFDWSGWEAGRILAERPDRLEAATPAEAAMVIFAVWRSARFVEGELLEAFENGLIQRAVRRVLAAERSATDRRRGRDLNSLNACNECGDPAAHKQPRSIRNGS